MSKLIKKAKKSLIDCLSVKLCTNTNETTLINETQCYQVIRNELFNKSPLRQQEVYLFQQTYGGVDNQTTIQTPVKATSACMLNKQTARSNLQSRFTSIELSSADNNQHEYIEHLTSIEISKFPLLLTTPEKPKFTKLCSTVIDNDTITDQPSLYFITEASPSLSQIDEQDEIINYQDIQNAYSNYLYESPCLIRQQSSSLISSDLSSSSSSFSKPFWSLNQSEMNQSYGLQSDQFHTANSDFFESDLNLILTNDSILV